METKQTPETIEEIIVRLSKTNTSNEQDAEIMQLLLHKMGFKNAVWGYDDQIVTR